MYTLTHGCHQRITEVESASHDHGRGVGALWELHGESQTILPRQAATSRVVPTDIGADRDEDCPRARNGGRLVAIPLSKRDSRSCW